MFWTQFLCAVYSVMHLDSLLSRPTGTPDFHHLLGGTPPPSRLSGAKKWPNFLVFRDCQTSFRKTSIISGTIIARANSETAFEREFNLETLIQFQFSSCRQIWPKVNDLASVDHRSQKSCFWAKSLTANNFFIFICTAMIKVPSCLSRPHESNYTYIRWPRKVKFIFDIW